MLTSSLIPGVGRVSSGGKILVGAGAKTGIKAFGTVMGVQETGRILQEMDDPAFDDVPDWQKTAFASAVGYVIAKLERLGASGIVGKNPIAKKIVLDVLKKNSGRKLTQKTIQEILEKEINSKIARGVFSVGVGGLMEGGTEVTQEVSEVALKRGFNTVKNVFGDDEKIYFNADQTEFNKDRIIKAFTVGSLAGGTFGTMNAFINAKRQGVVNQLNEGQYKIAREFFSDDATIGNKITELRTELASKGKSKKEIDNIIREIREIGSTFREIRKSTRLTADGEKRVFSLLQTKKDLQKQVDEASDKALVSRQKEIIAEIDSEISEITTSDQYDFDKNFARLQEQAKTETEKSGKEFNILQEEAYNNALSDLGRSESEYKGTTGYIHTDGNIYINESVAEQLREIPVSTHELLHGILNKQLKGKTAEESKKLISDFKNRLNKTQTEAVNKRLKSQYNINPEDATSQEWFTALSDGIVNNEVAFEETGAQELGRLLTNTFLKPFGYKNASFKNGRQAFNFVRDYAKQAKAIAEGKQQTFEGEVGAVVSEGVEGDVETKFSKVTEQTINNFTKKDGKPMSQVDWFNFTGEMNNEGDLVNQNKIANAFEGVINSKIKGTNKEVQNYFGRDRSTVIEDFKEILDKRGFFDSKIEQFNPEVNDNFSGYMAGIINNAYKTLLDQNTKRIKTVPTSKKVGGVDSKVTVGETLISDEISPEEYADIKLAQDKLKKNKPQQSAIAKKLGLTENEINLAKRDIISFLRKSDRPAMTDAKKFFKALVDYTTGKGVQPGGFAKVIYDKLSLPKDGRLSTKNREAFIKDIAEDLIALNKVDPAVMRRSNWKLFYELEIKNMNPTQTQKAIDEGRVPSTTNLKSGLDLFKTLDPSVDQVVDYLMGIRPDVLKRKMPKFLAEVIVKNEFNDIVDNTTQPIYDAKGNVTDNTINLSETVTEEEVKRGAPQVKEKIARPEGLKFSKSQQSEIDDLNLDKKLKNSFEKNVGQIIDNNPGITLEEAINLEYKKIGTNKGFAYENVIIERLKDLKIKGFKISTQAGGNKKGISDFAATLFENALNVEVKLAVAQYGDVGLRFRNGLIDFNENVKNKNYSFKKRIRKELFEKADKALKAYRKRAGELGADLDVYDKTRKLPTEIYLQLGEGLGAEGVAKLKSKYAAIKEKYPNGIKGEGLQKAITQVAEFDITPVREIYENKVPPTSYIQLQDSGLFFMGKNPLELPLPELTGNVDLTLRVSKGKSSVDKDGVMMTTVNLRILPSKLRNIPKSDYTLDSASSVSSLMKTKAVKILEAQVAAKNSNLKELPFKSAFSKTETNVDIVGYAKTVDEALSIARNPNAPVKKIRVFDFDDTLATTKSNVLYTKPDGTEGKLTAEQFAKQGAQLLEEGYTFDFSEFNKVTKGKPGPLLDIAKKIQAARGTEDVFVLTARAPESAVAIKEFLDNQGLDIPLENITGLGNSTGAAKANWMVNKAAEGYNDFYFADDAYQNVKAVQDAMSVLDVKSKVQQAKGQFSKNVDIDFNKIIEQTTGIAAEKEYSKAKAKVRGAGKGNKKFFIPYSAEDFMGLIYPLLSKGSLGDAQMAWFKENLLDPYARATENLSTDRLQLMQDFKALKKALEVPKNLRKKNDTGFTNEQAIRVYLFNRMGFEIPGLSKSDTQELIDAVNSDGLLKAFADQIMNLTKGDGYAKPGQSWLAGTITTDLIDVLNTVKRKKYLEQSGFLENSELVFSEKNLNKLEAAYGEKYRDSMENILKRMKSGKNRLFSGNKLSNRVLDYINGSIGTIMFFNTRSAVLQTISSINFINWSFNNPIKAGKAFANQKQYWSDFKELMNSDYLVDRRNGLKLNINENEIADAAATSKNKAKAAVSYILQKGFLPTQIADSFAIASGGATFYRNRINDLVKNEGLSEAEAKKQAMLEWRQVAEISQQSSDPSKISAQQSSDLGRVILAFANTPMQYARLQKRAAQDLINRRGDPKSHVSKIIYYGVVQNLIFNALQQALFAIGFGDDDEDKKEKQYFKTANGMLDSLLRGLGIAGASASVVKNFLLDVYERSGRKRPEYVDSVYKLLQISPPISSKISKVRQAAYQFDSKKRREEIFDKGFSLDNPAYEASAKVISATTNVPIDRLYSKINNIEAALAEDTETWQSVAMMAGWPEWQIKPKQTSKKDTKPKNKKQVKENLEKKLGIKFL
jgi:hypothetical protein